VKCTIYARFWPSTATSWWVPAKWRHLSVTSGHLRSRDIIFCHVTASSCEPQLCKKWNVQYTQDFGLLQPLPGDFRSNEWLPCHFQSPEFTWRHFPSRDFLLLRTTALLEVKWIVYAGFWPSTATSRWLPVKWRHLRVTSGHLRSRAVISCHVSASSCELRLVGSEMYSIRKCLAFYSYFLVTSGQMMSLPGHFWSPEVTCRYFLSRVCLLLRATPCSKWNI